MKHLIALILSVAFPLLAQNQYYGSFQGTAIFTGPVNLSTNAFGNPAYPWYYTSTNVGDGNLFFYPDTVSGEVIGFGYNGYGDGLTFDGLTAGDGDPIIINLDTNNGGNIQINSQVTVGGPLGVFGLLTAENGLAVIGPVLGEYGAPVLFGTPIAATNGIGSYSFDTNLFVRATGTTNTSPINYQLYGFVGVSVVLTNLVNGFHVSLGTISTPQQIILEPNDALIGTGCSVAGERSF
jgi:hypothetical protein